MDIFSVIRPSVSLPRTLARALVLLATLICTACDMTGNATRVSSTNIGQSIDPSEPLRVALLVPGGSGSQDLEWLARSLRNAARMAAADAEGVSFDLRFYDTGGSPQTAVVQANAAVDAGAQIILGPLFAESANAVGHAMMPRNVNVLTFSNNTQIAGGNVFILGNSFDNIADRLVSYGTRQGKHNILIVAENDVAGQLGGRAIENAITRNGAHLTGRVDHPISISGINAAAPMIVQATGSGHADVVFLTANNQAVLPYLTDTLARDGIRSPDIQVMGLTRWDQPHDRLRMPQLAEGWFAIPNPGLLRQFEAHYARLHNEPPHQLASLAYDGLTALASLAGEGRDDAMTTGGLTRQAGFSGIGGAFRLKGDGTIQRGLAVATIRNGQLVILDAAPRSMRGFGS